MHHRKFQFPVIDDSCFTDYNDKVCVVAVIGKSGNENRACKAIPLDEILNKSIFKCNISGYHDIENNVIYLHLNGIYDSSSLGQVCEIFQQDLEQKGFFHAWSDMNVSYVQAMLFIFLISHIVIIVHPTTSIDVTYLNIFKVLDTVRYYVNSLKSAERASRGETGGKVYEVSDQFRAPDPKAFFDVSENKAALLEYLCDNWVIGESVNPHQSIKLFLSGGFRDIHKSVMLTNGNESPVTELQSTHEEADTRLLLHSIYATQVEGVKRIVMYANDTDVIVLAVYYYKTKLKKLGLDEFWMKTQQDSYLPIHKIANTLDADLCRALPLIHSLSGRDITSHPFFIGKTTWLQKSKTVPLDYIASYAGAEDDYSLTKDVIDQARQLFIASNATDLKRLPSTEDAFLLHLERSAYACIIDKTAHIANPVIPEPTEYGWISEGDNMIPHQMRNPSWPADAAKATNCSCKKGCQKNCSCSNASRRCNIGCLCRGHPDTCKRARLQEELEQELENESSDEESSGSSEGELED
ncbi:Protein smg8 [Nymphon striatum]|nr:Protein smg8 [Nymphon striatum]